MYHQNNTKQKIISKQYTITYKRRERFHHFTPGHHYNWRPPAKWDWYVEWNKEWGLLMGKDCCAPDSVSFHYFKKPSIVRHMHALLYLCDNNDNGDSKK